jgi:NRPS condensation-like uncharacterized protein
VLIWSCIVPDRSGAPVFKPVAPGSIPLQVIENAEAEWTAHVAAQLEQRIDASKAPLLRATLLRGVERSVIILCVHHSIADGLALSFVLRNLLRALAGEAIRVDIETKSTEQLVAAGRDGLLTSQARAPSSLPSDQPLDGSKARVEALCLTREMTRSLRDRARGEGTTVHGALCAAVTTAAARMVPGWSEARLRVLSPIDIRARMLGGSEHVGLCVTAAVVENERPIQRFWSKARSHTA